METIKRKSLLYKTKVEYGDYTINHISGCSHGCKFPCYAMMLSKRFGRHKSYEDWCKPKLVENSIEILKKEIPKYKDKISFVNLCFMSDPFMYRYEEVKNMSLKIINLLNENNLKCNILTKGILPSELSNTSKNNEFGITLVSLDENFRKNFEPNTSSYKERIEHLKFLHDKGFYTWVSMEPYPTPNIIEQDIVLILNEIKFVDKIIFGKMNYNKLVSSYKDNKTFYNICSQEVIKFCIKNNIKYHIKKGTVAK